MIVPTVLRGLLPLDFCEIEIDGLKPPIKSTSGLGSWPRNCRAKLDRLSTYRRWPSAYSVSKASELLPDPLFQTLGYQRGAVRRPPHRGDRPTTAINPQGRAEEPVRGSGASRAIPERHLGL